MTLTPHDIIDLSEDGKLTKRIIKAADASAKKPQKGAECVVHYTGTLLDGTKFDSSRDRDQPFSFKLGQGQVIRGWDEGVASMQRGEVAELTCAPEYAYGQLGSPPTIPPNATLKFQVEVIDFEELAESAADAVRLATEQKDAGNASFKAGDYAQAVTAYLKALKFLDPKVVGAFEDQTALQTLQVSLRSNMAACHLKLQDTAATISNCNMVLEWDPNNAKAYFRMGQAFNLSGDFDEARSSLKKALELAPQDAAIQRELHVVDKRLRAYQQQQKQAFSKLFG